MVGKREVCHSSTDVRAAPGGGWSRFPRCRRPAAGDVDFLVARKDVGLPSVEQAEKPLGQMPVADVLGPVSGDRVCRRPGGVNWARWLGVRPGGPGVCSRPVDAQLEPSTGVQLVPSGRSA